MPLVRIVALLAALCLPTPSAASDVCFLDDTNEYAYKLAKLKVPKAANTIVPVAGLAISAVSINAVPVSGSLIRDGNTGGLFLGLTRFGDRCLLYAQLDEDLNGSISSDCNLDDANDGTVELVRIDCAELNL